MRWTNRMIALGLAGGTALLLPYTDDFPGASGDFPRLLIWVIIGLSAVLLARSFVPGLASVSAAEGERDMRSMVRPLCAFAATTLAVILMQHIGFYPAIVLLGLGLMGVLGARRPFVFLGTLLGLIVFVFLLFEILLRVPLGSTGLWAG